MIRSKTTVTPFNGDDVINFALGQKEVAAEVFIETTDIIRPQALAELSVTPRPSSQPVDWQTPRQRMAYFASDGFGQGIPTVRRSGPANVQESWRVTGEVDKDEFSFVIRNDDPGAKYVYGSLSKRNPGRFQQRQHIKTGWLNGYRVVTFWQNAHSVLYRDRLRKRLKQNVQEFQTRRRAYTAPRRKSS